MDEIIEEVTEQALEGFVIDNDGKAEWALKKIKEAEEEHDRLMALIVAEQAALEQKEKEIDKKLEQSTSYLKYLLNSYMETVKCKETKTQKSYQLLTGKLVRKVGGIDYIKDDDELLNWTALNKPEFIKTKSSVDWAGLKKELVVDGENVITSDGEILDCIRAEKKPDSFDIRW